MGSFDQNFQSLVQLKKDRLGLEANQQQFDQNEAFFRRAGELEAQKISNQKSQFELDRAKGFMPHELRMAGLQSDAASQNLYDQKQQSDFGAEMNKFDIKNRSMDTEDRAMSRIGFSGPSYSAPRLGGEFGGLGGSSSYSGPAIKSGYNPAFSQKKHNPFGYADGGPVQDVQSKGFVPVRVSNGEYEFTPEQVANIGAAVLANSGGKAQPPMGLDSMG